MVSSASMQTSSGMSSKSAAVSTAMQRGSASSAAVSMPRISACGCGLRTTAACSIPWSLMSEMYFPRPRSSRGSSLRFSGAPNGRPSPALTPGSR